MAGKYSEMLRMLLQAVRFDIGCSGLLRRNPGVFHGVLHAGSNLGEQANNVGKAPKKSILHTNPREFAEVANLLESNLTAALKSCSWRPKLWTSKTPLLHLTKS